MRHIITESTADEAGRQTVVSRPSIRRPGRFDTAETMTMSDLVNGSVTFNRFNDGSFSVIVQDGTDSIAVSILTPEQAERLVHFIQETK